MSVNEDLNYLKTEVRYDNAQDNNINYNSNKSGLDKSFIRLFLSIFEHSFLCFLLFMYTYYCSSITMKLFDDKFFFK
jgi:hypothetical protein